MLPYCSQILQRRLSLTGAEKRMKRRSMMEANKRLPVEIEKELGALQSVWRGGRLLMRAYRFLRSKSCIACDVH
jgi:hypothetical protein